MWACDLVCDLHWLKERVGRLGTPSFQTQGYSEMLGAQIDVLLFVDGAFRHARFVLHTNDVDLAQRCVLSNISTWVDSIEAGVILNTRESFSVPKVDGASGFMTVLGEYHGGEHVTAYAELNRLAFPPDANIIGASLAIWRPDLRHHLFYFRRMIDPDFTLDQRWFYAYKLFEWHFAKKPLGSGRSGKKVELVDSQEWKDFVDKYQTQLLPYLKTDQKPFRLVEQVRAMVAHAYVDDDPREDSSIAKSDLIRLTFPIMRDMVNDLLNELKDPSVPVNLTS